MHFPRLVSTVTLLLAAAACSDSNDNSPATTTNPNQPAGSAGSGGGANSGGAGSGGSAATPAGNSGSGGSSEATPNPTLNPGGDNGNGSGSAAAGAPGMAGAPGAAGAPPVITADAGAAVPADGMSFFVTSRGLGDGGNLGGLAGADAFCRTLAAAVDPALANKTWRAYLSTSMVNARDRIGNGPWRNAAGDIIANSVADLHDQAAGGALDDTWAVNDFTVPLDETGAQVPQNVHDILTGSQQDGTLATGQTCNDWTSDSATATAQIGHLNRAGLNGQPPSWNSVHTVNCAPLTAPAPNIGSGGGRGSIYCFATD
jgi:hypothetical protein